ncbi:DUF6238 family protein [Streptomyces uncialis]|uniref:DUF6238 family protein n=1 Tax=Streptomyces uncialis TaxID=1048205 RepID=UPI003865384C|nr:DUF6238 family protein [Streptomyces uncialis]
MTSPPDASPYLRAATAGLRHHARALITATPSAPRPADRAHLDTLHAHLTALHRLLDQCAEQIRPSHPTAGRHLAAGHTLIWQATAAVHDAFHTLPATPGATGSDCEPERLPQGPPVLTICQRHLAAGHAIRRKTTPTDLTPLHGHTTRAS